jgi:hypothetical protein
MSFRKAVLIILICTYTVLNGQNPRKETIIPIKSQPVRFQFPNKKTIEPIQQTIPDEMSKVEKAIQQELKEYVTEMQDQKFISDNVVTEVNVEKANDDMKVVYSYYLINDTLKFRTDDFGLGKYRVNESNGLMVTLGIMKKTVEGQLAHYIVPQTRISLTIHGSADAVPIRRVIAYEGDFGDKVTETCNFDSGIKNMEISVQKGITDNPGLAFIRSYAVKDYIDKNIAPLQLTQNLWHFSASVSNQRGGEFRRVSIEMIIEGALKNN